MTNVDACVGKLVVYDVLSSDTMLQLKVGSGQSGLFAPYGVWRRVAHLGQVV